MINSWFLGLDLYQAVLWKAALLKSSDFQPVDLCVMVPWLGI